MIALNSSLKTTASETNTNILDDIEVDELFKLKREIDAFVNAQDAAEQAFCNGDFAYEDCQNICTEKALALKSRIRSLAIAMGVHADFLKEYSLSCKRNGLELAPAVPF